jgi:hypothetical protein
MVRSLWCGSPLRGMLYLAAAAAAYVLQLWRKPRSQLPGLFNVEGS